MNDPIEPRWQDALAEHRQSTEPTPQAWASILDRAAEPTPADLPETAVGRGPRARRMLAAAAAVAVLGLAAAGAIALSSGDNSTNDVASGPTASGPDDTGPGSTAPPGEGPTDLYEASGTVLENADHGPELCSAVMSSYPPQCSGIPIEGWDWDAVDGAESANGVTWGEYRIVGGYDGEVFRLTDVPAPTPEVPDPGVDAERFKAPCPTPEGGWVTTDPSKVALSDRTAMQAAAEADPQYSGLWVDASVPAPGGMGLFVVAFTGDLDRHAAELAQIWGGPICVTRATHTEAELLAAVQTVQSAADPDGRVEIAGHRFRLSSSSIDPIDGVVDLGIDWAPAGAEADIAAELGVPVRLLGQIQPVG